MLWFYYALIGAVLIAIETIALKKLTQMNLSNIAINTLVFTGVAVAMLVYFFISKSDISLKKEHIKWVAIAIVSTFLFIILSLEAFKLAPNPGYVNAIQGFCAVIVTVLSIFIFGTTFSVVKFIGIIFVLIGIFAIGYG